MRKKDQLYEVEIRSLAIIRENQKSLITYFRGGNKKTIVKRCRLIYPQYTNPEDKPNISITPITNEEYEKRKEGIITQKRHLVKAS